MQRALWIPLRPGAAAVRVACLADAIDARVRTHAPLLELHRAHLEHGAPGRSRSAAEHALELVELGLRWRAHAPAARRGRGAEAGHAELDRLVARLAALRLPEPELSRIRAWRDFARAEDVAVISDASALAAWFEVAARDTLGPELAAEVEEALALVRTEVIGRALRRRPARTLATRIGALTGTASRPLSPASAAPPRPSAPAAAPAPGPGPADRSARAGADQRRASPRAQAPSGW